jgi:hypothetical protein
MTINIQESSLMQNSFGKSKVSIVLITSSCIFRELRDKWDFLPYVYRQKNNTIVRFTTTCSSSSSPEKYGKVYSNPFEHRHFLQGSPESLLFCVNF